jgi:hypothetical protein
VDEASTELSRSQVPYGEGVAIHTGPESCGGGSNVMAEALTGVRIGQVLSREMLVNSRVLTPCVSRKAIPDMTLLRDRFGLCAIGDLGMYGSTLHGNREIPQPASEWVAEVRPGNLEGTRQGCTEVGSRTAS